MSLFIESLHKLLITENYNFIIKNQVTICPFSKSHSSPMKDLIQMDWLQYNIELIHTILKGYNIYRFPVS